MDQSLQRQQPLSRRRALKAAAGLAAGLPLARRVYAAPEILKQSDSPAQTLDDRWRGLRAGAASYSFRKLPLDATIKAINRLDLKFVSIKDFHLPLKSTTEERKAVAQKFRDAGIEPISCGVIGMETEAAARQGFEYARDIGAPVIVCNPNPELLPLLDKLVKETHLKLAIHNHGPEDKRFASPYDVMKAIEGSDPRIGLCIDVGHTARAGVDPAEAITKCRERVYDVHFKDVAHRDRRGSEVEVGRGVLDIRTMLAALLEIKYAYHVGFEHEKNAEDPLPGVAESIGFTRGVLSAMK